MNFVHIVLSHSASLKNLCRILMNNYLYCDITLWFTLTSVSKLSGVPYLLTFYLECTLLIPLRKICNQMWAPVSQQKRVFYPLKTSFFFFWSWNCSVVFACHCSHYLRGCLEKFHHCLSLLWITPLIWEVLWWKQSRIKCLFSYNEQKGKMIIIFFFFFYPLKSWETKSVLISMMIGLYRPRLIIPCWKVLFTSEKWSTQSLVGKFKCGFALFIHIPMLKFKKIYKFKIGIDESAVEFPHWSSG